MLINLDEFGNKIHALKIPIDEISTKSLDEWVVGGRTLDNSTRDGQRLKRRGLGAVSSETTSRHFVKEKELFKQ